MTALTVTPATVGEIFSAKALISFIVTIVMGILILVINRAFGFRPGLLVLIMGLGAVMSVTIGLLLGALVEDTNTLFTIWKSAGALLFAPAVVYMFPKVPRWIGRIFPTYYLLEPIMEISLKGAGWSEIGLEMGILVGIIIALIILTTIILKRLANRAAF
jgi:ABC-2 type transport system permease protein